MLLARNRDAIARLWADHYTPLFRSDSDDPGMVWILEEALATGLPAGAAIQHAFLHHLAFHHDSLIRRRHGEAVATEVSQQAAAILSLPPADRPAAVERFDATLRAGSRCDGHRRPINPGTTADLVAAGLFVLLRRGWSLGGLPVTMATLRADPR
jgi:triphosphoribosyl-dephospho-CoA synthase